MAKKTAAPKEEKVKKLDERKESRAVAVQESNVPAVADAPIDEAWGTEGLDASDMLVPKLLLMQGLSKFVTDGDAQQGQVVDSLSKEVVGGITNIKAGTGDKVELVVFSTFKTWIEFEKIDDEYEFVKQFPMNASNVNLAQEEVVNGIEVRRDRCLNFYVLLPSQIADGSALPYVISFRRTSMRAGKKISSMAQRLKALGRKPIAFKKVVLSVVPMQRDDKKWWSYEMEEGENSSQAELNEAHKWYQVLKSATVRVDDSDLKEKAEAPAPVVSDAEQEY